MTKKAWILLFLFSLLFSFPSFAYEGYLRKIYRIRGWWYIPMSVDGALRYEKKGIASWYDESKFLKLKRGKTSLGEEVPFFAIGAAHKTLPLPCMVKVTNLKNGKSLNVRINDRGPFIRGRLIDLTPTAAKLLGFKEDGLVLVHIRVLSVGEGKYKKKAKEKFLWIF